MKNRWLGLMALPLVLTACGGGDEGSADSGISGKPSGEITVLTNRTDIVDTDLKKYAAAFEKKYPDVKVEFQAITDYEGEVKIRMNTDDYGDVLLIPGSVQRSDYPKFFEPLGSPGEMAQKYNWTDFATVQDKTYGLAPFGTANGFVYNKKVWAAAGVTSTPTTPQEFLAGLKAIKDKTDAIPYYTNYKDGWPLGSWYEALGSATCDTGANRDLATTKKPWDEGEPLKIVDTMLYDMVAQKLVEPDPATTSWEDSKNLLGGGKVGAMWLGSFAVSQMRDAATKAGGDPEDIGFLPFPARKDGKFCSVTVPDARQAINVHSEHKAAAYAWIKWFTEESGFAQKEGAIPTVKGAEMPATLADHEKAGVKYIQLDQSKAAEVGMIDQAAEVGLGKPDYRRRIIDVARGAGDGDLQDIFGDLNEKWSNGLGSAGL
ncbi:ABC transporter substrate-binding protein [Streptomyces sp. NPDC059720]|uniref:ABC transporter substrate-binding protein n=1 Tax=Streptomyces sp. NPDC059720 TaxID=3346924 RepID=UPI0036871CC6